MTHLHAQPLEKTLRNALERAVSKARTVAEEAARQELTRLGVGEAKAPDFLTAEQRTLRTRLRALGRQLGDIKEANATQSIENLVTSVAYEHWHRMLFARYLEQNNLLMYDQYTALTLDECNELAQDPSLARDEQEKRCTNGWELAAVLASKMLPQIFRIDSPVFELAFAPALQRELTLLVNGLAPETFHASDSLGWVYQFWQADNKDRINQSEVKIGARELPAVTQLFTEPYMVSFLLDNALGAWWANQRLSEQDWLNAQSEAELRQKASIPGVPLTYLRFVQVEGSEQGSAEEEGAKRWTPAAGAFDSWPNALSELKTLDPSCGSGHFLVATLLMLVPMRMALENLNAQQAIDAVLTENIHGLELDQRCVELAAFALALEAWRYPNAGGYRALPELHLACSGLSVQAAKEEWKQLAADNNKSGKKNLSIALDWLHDSFQDAPVLGSLINPAKSKAANIVPWAELQQALNTALTQENDSANDKSSDQQEATVVAQGLAKAASLLSGQYSWVITNVPYLARGKQHDTLKDFCEQHYPEGKNDLATVFLDRCLELCHQGGTASIVLPQNWLFLTSYKKFREKLLKRDTWNLIARLGEGGFDSSAAAGAFVAMIALTRGQQQEINEGLFAQTAEQNTHQLRGLDVSEPKTAEEKAEQLLVTEIKSVGQAKQLENPDARVAFDQVQGELLEKYAFSFKGITTGDDLKFRRNWWEIKTTDKEVCFFQSSVSEKADFGGAESVIMYEKMTNPIQPGVYLRASEAIGKKGIMVSQMRNLLSVQYIGTPFDTNAAAIISNDSKNLPAIWCFCSSPEYNEAVRRIDQKLNVTNATLVKVPFDLEHWSKIAEEQYPHGLPQPYSNDPTQWIFHGHPCGSVVWSDTEKRTVEGELRIDDTVLQVAVARLLGYRWPAGLDAEMEFAPEQRAWVERSQTLNQFEDDDGIVCLPAVRGESAADQRLEAILEAAYSEQGGQWTVATRSALLKLVGGKSLAHWLRDKFFEQHCKLFQHRPFIWHIWDGLNDGFSVLVNYHKFNKAGLERLIYTYLSDWITTQQAGLQNGTDGAQERLAAAEILKKELEAILKGEKPYDIFVRWKPLTEQPIGWNPDLNDGVRLNIRPFMLAKDLGKKDAGILRAKPNIHWQKDRGTDVATAPWYKLGLEYGGKEGDRINEHHLSLEGKRKAKEVK